MDTIYICANVETLVDGYGIPSEAEQDTAADMQQAAIEVAENSGVCVELKFERQFRDWHGGRFDQFYDRPSSFVAVRRDCSAVVRSLAEAMGNAMCDKAAGIGHFFATHQDFA